MSLPVLITGRDGNIAEVTKLGQLVVAPLAYNETKFVELDVNDQIYNFYAPKTSQQFVITAILARADKGVSSVTDATVVIFEAESEAGDIDKVLYQDAMVQDDRIVPIGVNILVNPGKWINAKSTDTDIHMNILGYYIPELT